MLLVLYLLRRSLVTPRQPMLLAERHVATTALQTGQRTHVIAASRTVAPSLKRRPHGTVSEQATVDPQAGHGQRHGARCIGPRPLSREALVSFQGASRGLKAVRRGALGKPFLQLPQDPVVRDLLPPAAPPVEPAPRPPPVQPDKPVAHR